jgi:polar amino acid transport system substrate-binding protein
VAIDAHEKAPAFGSFAFPKADYELRGQVDEALQNYLGSREHRAMMKQFGFSDADIDLVVL